MKGQHESFQGQWNHSLSSLWRLVTQIYAPIEILKGLLEKRIQGQSCGQKWAVGPVDTGADSSPAILSCSQVRPGTAPAPRCQAFLAAAWDVAWSLGLGRDTEGPEGWHHLEIKAGAVDWTPQSGTEEGLEVPRS